MLSAETIHAFRAAHWRRWQQVPSYILNPAWRPWVLASGSLTQKLIRASHGNFRVQVAGQYWALPWPSEQLALNLPMGQQVLVREVALVCYDEPWVQARTVIPATTLSGRRRRLSHLGDTPLGAYLFKCPDMRRGPLEIAPLRIQGYQALGYQARGNQAPEEQALGCQLPVAWGRRSLFLLSEYPLLVSEFFLPEILSADAPRNSRQG